MICEDIFWKKHLWKFQRLVKSLTSSMTKHFNLKHTQNSTKLTFSRTVHPKKPTPMPKVPLHSVFYLKILSHPSLLHEIFGSILVKFGKWRSRGITWAHRFLTSGYFGRNKLLIERACAAAGVQFPAKIVRAEGESISTRSN